jgi:hypothetical protein
MSHSSSDTSKKFPLATSIIFTLIAAVILLVATAYFFRNAVLTYTAIRYLQTRDIELISLQGLAFDRSQMEVSSAFFRIKSSTTQQRLSNVTVSYSLSGLRSGAIESISIQEAMLSLPLMTSDPSPPSQAPPDTATVLAVLQDLPMKSFTVSQLTLPPYLSNAGLHVSNTGRELRLLLSAGEVALTSTVNWHNEDFVSSHFISNEQLVPAAFSPPVLTGRLQVESHGEAILDVDFSLNEADEDLALEAVARINTKSLPALISSYVTLPDHWPQLTGNLDASLRARLEKNSSNVPFYHFTLNPGSHFTASHLNGVVPALEQASVEVNLSAPIHVSGRFPGSEDLIQMESERVSLKFHELPDAGELTLQFTDLRTYCQLPLQCTSQQKFGWLGIQSTKNGIVTGFRHN